MAMPKLGGNQALCSAVEEGCSKAENWIELDYRYANGDGVGGAHYRIQHPNGGQVGGALIAEGKLGADGQARVTLPEDIEQVEVLFQGDPPSAPYHDPLADKLAAAAMAADMALIWQGPSPAGHGTSGQPDPAPGDLNAATMMSKTVQTMVPGLDALTDGSQMAASLRALLLEGRWHEDGIWFGVFLGLLSQIPDLGSLAKGIVAAAAQGETDREQLLAIYNFHNKGNGVRWLRQFAADLPTAHAQCLAEKFVAALDAASTQLRALEADDSLSSEALDAQKRLLASVSEVRSMAAEKLAKVASASAAQIEKSLTAGKARVIPSSTQRKVHYRQWRLPSASYAFHGKAGYSPTAFGDFEWDKFKTGRKGVLKRGELSQQDQFFYRKMLTEGRNNKAAMEVLESATTQGSLYQLNQGERLYGLVTEGTEAYKTAQNAYWLAEKDYQALKSVCHLDGRWDHGAIKDTLALPCPNQATSLVVAEVTQSHKAIRTEVGPAEESLQYFDKDGCPVTEPFLNKMPGGGWQTTPNPNAIQIG